MFDVKWRRRVAVLLGSMAFAGSAMGQESCEEAAKDLEESGKELEDASGENNKKYAAKIKQVKIGMSKAEVRSIMGAKPRDTQRMESEDFEGGTTVNETWYYGSYQLSFDDGKLTSKNRY